MMVMPIVVVSVASPLLVNVYAVMVAFDNGLRVVAVVVPTR